MTELAQKILTWTESDIAKGGGLGRRLSKIFLYMGLDDEDDNDILEFHKAIEELVNRKFAFIEEFKEFGFVYLIPIRGMIKGKGGKKPC